MQDITISKHGDEYRMTPWKDRDNPTESELRPEGAEYSIYTVMPTDWVEYVAGKSKEDISAILSGFPRPKKKHFLKPPCQTSTATPAKRR